MLCTIVPLGLTAPFGTTILGWIAISQIRHSAGKIYGLGLAFFDGLLFPLLLLDGLLGGLINGAVIFVRDSLPPSALHNKITLSTGRILDEPTFLCRLFFEHHPELTQFLWLVTIIIVDWLIIRWVWRAVNESAGLPFTRIVEALDLTPPK